MPMIYPFQSAQRAERNLKRAIQKCQLVKDRLSPFIQMTRAAAWRNWLEEGLAADMVRIRKERESADINYKPKGLFRWFPLADQRRLWRFSKLGAQLEIYERIFDHIETLTRQYRKASDELAKLEAQAGTVNKGE
jgi:hypothetical protein